MPSLIGDQLSEELTFELLDNSLYISENLNSVIVGPGCGEGALLNTGSITEMMHDLQALEYVGVIVSWFVNSKDLSARLRPGVEKTIDEADLVTDIWQVGQFDRNSAHRIYRSDPSDPSTVRYGGTMPDSDVFGYFLDLKLAGLKTAFYPFILIDNEEKDWRGYITGDSAEVDNFYHTQYRPFIMHYVELLHNVVDIFYLGSELQGLTCIKGEGRDFPFVSCLIRLAAEVKGILGAEVEVSYAANWSEYHSCRNGFRPLDDLWSSRYIDFVAIDYYMPLTDHQGEEEISKAEILAGLSSGEGYDYFYDSSGARLQISNCSARWKDLVCWYKTEHPAYDPETREHYSTSWRTHSKPIVFSEFGFPSIDKATNQPSVSGDELPKHSSGDQDIALQLRAIRAIIEHINKSDFIQRGFAYCWDTRGKGWQEFFVDGRFWAKGHWIDGKIITVD
jgi:hypothetical protein